MRDLVTLAAALASLGLIWAIRFRHIRARPGSWARTEMVEMILVALLVGVFPLALAAAGLGLWAALVGGVTAAHLVSAGVDALALVLVVLTAVAFARLAWAEGHAHD